MRRDALRFAIAAGVFALLAARSEPASAVYQCGPDTDTCKCGMDDPYPCCSNGGNCTWWAWEQACCSWGVGLPGWGNANQWAGNAKTNPNYDVLSKPVAGSIANKVSGSYGHVAWVKSVSGSTITVSEQNCWGGWGHQTSTYNASNFDGGFIVRHSQCDCSPGETQTESCGNCGERKRSCSTSCSWNSWGACGSEGACTPGTTEDKACGDCGEQTRKCKDDCSWGSYDACAGPDPSGPSATCDTGLKGVCAKGAKQCVEGTTECVATETSSKEICDGLDNDCNGFVDDSTDCWKSGSIDAGKSSKTSHPDAGTNGAEDSSDMDGGVSCTISSRRDAGETGLGWALGLALALLVRRRPARRRE
jgi:CHAP domain